MIWGQGVKEFGMYNVNETIHYGGSGVCTIQEIAMLRFGRTRERYYVLKPLHQNTSVIYVPVNNEQLVSKMRPVLTREEVESLISEMPSVETNWIEDAQDRKAYFDELLRKNNCTDLVRIIKALTLQKERRQQIGKTLHVTDENYLREARRLLFDEFAGALGMKPSEVDGYIVSRLGESA